MVQTQTAAQRQDQVVSEFSQILDWEEKYKKIIELGKSLPDLEESLKTEKNKVKGCQSQVWLQADFKEGRVYFRGDSDALIVKGLVALLLKIYSGGTPEEIMALEPRFVEEIGFATHLSPSRSNGLFSMIKQIKLFAMALHMMQKANQH